MDEGTLQGSELEDSSKMSLDKLITVDPTLDDLTNVEGEWPGYNMGKKIVTDFIKESKEVKKEEMLRRVAHFLERNRKRRIKIRQSLNKVIREMTSASRTGSDRKRGVEKLWKLMDETENVIDENQNQADEDIKSLE